MDRETLTAVFHKLGAHNPEMWAASEIEEGVPQLVRYLFLKGAWDNMASETDLSWINRTVDAVPPDSVAPYAGAAHAMRRMLEAGVSRADIAELVRCQQAEFLFSLCYMMSDPSSVEGNDGLVYWSLFEVDDEEHPGRCVDGLHESVLETDPTGRELRPKPPEV